MKIWRKSANKRNGKPFKAIKVWLVIGASLSPIVAVGATSGLVGYLTAVGFFVTLALSVTTCVLTWHAINAVEEKREIIPFAVCALIFCSLIAGILLLAVDEAEWRKTSLAGKAKPETAPKPEEAKPTEEGK